MKPKIHSAAVSQCGHLIYGVGLILLLHYVTNLIFWTQWQGEVPSLYYDIIIKQKRISWFQTDILKIWSLKESHLEKDCTTVCRAL